MPTVEVGQFDAVVETHAVAQPVEPVREDDSPFRTRGYAVEIDRGYHLVAPVDVQLDRGRVRECVRFPRGHKRILPNRGPDARLVEIATM